MGKYMRRKSKTTGEVSLMEVPSLGGVLTRAKTLALQKASAAVASIGAGSYIQLRSRRLVKPTSEKKQKETGALTNPNKASLRGTNSSRLKVDEKLVYEELEICQNTKIKVAVDLGIDYEEGSFGENMVEMEGRGRWVFFSLSFLKSILLNWNLVIYFRDDFSGFAFFFFLFLD